MITSRIRFLIMSLLLVWVASSPISCGAANPPKTDHNPPDENTSGDVDQAAELAPGADSDSAAKTDTKPHRLFALGDLHADLKAIRDVLMMIGAIDKNDQWIGGNMVIVQVGDLVDRGWMDREAVDFMEDITQKAAAEGGRVYLLNGNHEIMNVKLDLRYVDDKAWAAFDNIPYDPNDPQLMEFPQSQRGRVAAIRPGGIYAKIWGGHQTVLVLDDTVFVHGSLLPEHLEYAHTVEKINRDISNWMNGEAENPSYLTGSDGPAWNRTFSTEAEANCHLLEAVLSQLSAKRMVVAHTVQDSINSACNDKVWRVDTGMSYHYGGPSSALEITRDVVTVH